MKKILSAVIIAAICAGVFFLCRFQKKPQNDGIMLGSEYDREAYLNIKGYDVTLVSETEIRIPQSFGGAYEGFAEVQRGQSLPLEEHRGDTVKRYVYLANEPSDLFAELLISDGELIASAVLDKSKGTVSKP